MWKLWNFIFGWDYIAWSNFADNGITRVYKGGNGCAFYVRYKSTDLVDLIEKPDQVIWLTCDSSKYMNHGGIK